MALESISNGAFQVLCYVGLLVMLQKIRLCTKDCFKLRFDEICEVLCHVLDETIKLNFGRDDPNAGASARLIEEFYSLTFECPMYAREGRLCR